MPLPLIRLYNKGKRKARKIISKKLGRPPKNKHPRNEKLTLMLSTQEKDLIGQLSEKLKLSRTDTIMKAIIELEKNL